MDNQNKKSTKMSLVDIAMESVGVGLFALPVCATVDFISTSKGFLESLDSPKNITLACGIAIGNAGYKLIRKYIC